MSAQEQLDQNNRTIPGGVAPGSGTTLPALQMGAPLTDATTGLSYAPGTVQVIDSAGVNVGGVDSSHNQLVKVNAALPAGTNVIGLTKTVDSAGTNVGGVDAFHNLYITDGGQNTMQVTASSAAAIKTAAGRLCKVIPTTTVTTAVNVYDNTNAASGTVLCAIPASAAIGTVYNVQALCANGIYVGGASGSPQLLVLWD